jgi:DNA-binding NarL/FixJ family response regulator
MNWCKKGKAPKTMQAEYDRAIRLPEGTDEAIPSSIFKVDILASAATTEELEALKEQYGLSKKGGKPKTDKSTPKSSKVELTPEEALTAMGTLDTPEQSEQSQPEPQPEPEQTQPDTNWEAIFNDYKNGKAVKDICAELGVSKSTFYNKTKSFK